MENIPKNLIEKLQDNNVVLFLGAGLSINAGYPSWKGLIKTILENLGDKEQKKEGYLNALNEDILSPIEVLGKIEPLKDYAIEIFDKELRKYNHCSPTTIHEKVGKLTSKIITTNYDCLLESSNNDFEKVIYSNKYKVAKISEYEKYIFKIHGDINEPDKCILFPKEYEELYSKEEKTSVFELKKIISDKSILFIGFSLDDPYIKFIFDFVTNLYSGFSPEHFIITSDKDKIWPQKVTPIFIDDYYLNLESVIDFLITEKNKKIVEKNEDLNNVLLSDTSIIKITRNLEYDIPPNVKFWVGRKKEIKNISNENFRVIFITGIGGQGKSALAAHFIKNNFDTNVYELADWRDFKEENNRFQTKIISIIQRLTNGEVNAKELENLINEELVDTFFHYLSSKKAIFVFDNIDSYIDLESFKPTGGFGYFFNQAMNVEHNSRFIFTCRPFIREASVNFYQISLLGLSVEESLELFSFYDIPVSKSVLKELAFTAHTLTKGHPLWLNLIAAQAVRGIETVNKFIKSIEDKSNFDEDNFSSILSEQILDEVWNSLNDKQRILLRSLAEIVKPETINSLSNILDSELNINQINKAFRTLKNLNLVEIKTSSISEDQIELHPLVKEYILQKYPKNERVKYITLLVQYYDSFIYILKPKLSSVLSLHSFQNWTSKIELEINRGSFKPALVALEEVSSSILSAGFSEEYLRVAEKLFEKIDWQEAIENEFPYFHSQFSTLTTILTQFGKYSLCLEFLEKFNSLIPGKSVYYLNYCSAKCHLLWYQEKYEDAIQIGEEGVLLLTESGLADNHGLKHNLALAQRDSSDIHNIKIALQFFQKNETLEKILDKENVNYELGGHFYGNVGKCLEHLNKIDDALFCYCISLQILIKDDNEGSKNNIGYACSWISEVLFKRKNIIECLYFLKYGINIWSKTSPPRAEKLKLKLSKIIFDKESKTTIEKMPDWKIENYCKKKAQELSGTLY